MGSLWVSISDGRSVVGRTGRCAQQVVGQVLNGQQCESSAMIKYYKHRLSGRVQTDMQVKSNKDSVIGVTHSIGHVVLAVGNVRTSSLVHCNSGLQ